MAVTWASALSWRLGRHYLGDQRATSVEDVVDRLVAVPAWSGDAGTAIRLRLTHPVPGDVDVAIAAGRVFVTYAFRGATHLMTPSSAAVHLALRCAGRQWELASWRRHYGVEPQDWPRLRAAVRDALGGGPLTQQELGRAVTADPAYAHLLPAFTDRSHTFLKPFGWQGDLCFSPSPGAATFRLLDGLPGWSGLAELDDAGPRAVRAYLATYGPATVDRVHYWLGEGLSAGRRRIDGWIGDLGDEVAALPIEGAEALCLARDAESLTASTPSEEVVLLPGSDQWVLGPGTSVTHVVPAEHRAVATRGANLVLVGGRVRGTWKVDHGTLRTQWFDGEDAAGPAALSGPVERLSAALGRELQVPARVTG